MSAKKFQKNVENFECENCGFKVEGTGYTNHCPKCLWSKHVDINPGDRKSSCHGMMEPIGVEIKNSEYIIIHSCNKCGFEKRNKSSENDDFDVIIKLSTNPVVK